jgi:hypothetical protein
MKTRTTHPDDFESLCELEWMDGELSEIAADLDGHSGPRVFERERQRVIRNKAEAEKEFGRPLTFDEVQGCTDIRDRVKAFSFTSSVGYTWQPHT